MERRYLHRADIPRSPVAMPPGHREIPAPANRVPRWARPHSGAPGKKRITNEMVCGGTMFRCSTRAPPRLISTTWALFRVAVTRPSSWPPTSQRVWRRRSFVMSSTGTTTPFRYASQQCVLSPTRWSSSTGTPATCWMSTPTPADPIRAEAESERRLSPEHRHRPNTTGIDPSKAARR